MFVLNASSGTISIALTVDVTLILVISESSMIIWYKMSAVMVKRLQSLAKKLSFGRDIITRTLLTYIVEQVLLRLFYNVHLLA